MIKEVLAGFSVKLITGFDDTITHVPVISSVTKTRRGKVAFTFGIFLAITAAIILSYFFSSLLKSFAYYNYIAAGLIFLLTFSIYFDIFLPKSKEKSKKKLKKVVRQPSIVRMIELIGIGFITAFVTVIDDSIAYSSVFLLTTNPLPTIMGIYAATILQIIAIIYFSKKIQKIKWKKQISAIGLTILGILILFKVI